MSEIDDLQRRLTAALDRIAAGVAELPQPTSTPSGADSDEAVNREERDAAVTARTRIEARLVEMERDLTRLRQSNDQLRETSQALRDANEARVGDSQLINAALAAELEALRTTHAAGQTEVRAILDALAPLVGPAQSDRPLAPSGGIGETGSNETGSNETGSNETGSGSPMSNTLTTPGSSDRHSIDKEDL